MSVMASLFALFKTLVTSLAPVILITSPIVSYADQIYSMYRKRDSSGFSLDIPLIMLIASITKVFYWLGNPYDIALFIQACNMIIVQTILLHIALKNRSLPDPATDLSTPFAGATSPTLVKRPYDFWQWRNARPYWTFMAYFALTLCILQVLIGSSQTYIGFLGALALGVEAILPLPQIIANYSQRSCKGFRLSVLINWLGGDVFKTSFFLLAESNVPIAFKLCGLFQFACDLVLAWQYATFGDGVAQVKEAVQWVEGKVGFAIWPERLEEGVRRWGREKGWL